MSAVDTEIEVAARAVEAVKTYGEGEAAVHALAGVTVDFPSRRFTAIMGPSGSGKSTLMQCVAGLDRLTSGQAFVGDTELSTLDKTHLTLLRRDRLGFIFQQYNLIPTIDAASNAAVPLIAQGVDRLEATERATELLDRLNMADHARKLPSQLSGGQQQRVAIARALVHEPRLVVCDEPTAALDARSGRRVMDLLRDVGVAEDRSVIIVTHDNRVFDLADRILVMEDGRITHDGTEMPDHQS